MVIALGPGKFYGSSLPRPRFFSDVKFNDERIDPPAPVFDPLLSWANEAHWSMGGLSIHRHRLQGRIEGSIKKLRLQQDRSSRIKKFVSKIQKTDSAKSPNSDSSESSEEIAPVTPLPQPKKKRARKLMEEFERVAVEEKSRKIVLNGEVSGVSLKKIEVENSGGLRMRRSPVGSVKVEIAVRRTSPRKFKG